MNINTRSRWFEDLKVPFGEGNNTETAEKAEHQVSETTCFASDM